MAKGYQANQERLAQVAGLGKVLARRAAFKCEWCEGRDDLKPCDLDPAEEPSEATVALLCGNCRGLAGGKRGYTSGLRSLQGALWHSEPVVAAAAARVLARSGESWAREAIEDSMLDDALKQELLGQ
ncbi:MAG: hypothetical protein FJZ01_21755 [Candidatus Sericytochromatia bacterium]|nr:hypothetical protein [Candidatus Tanganyikabacteria bacterium]